MEGSQTVALLLRLHIALINAISNLIRVFFRRLWDLGKAYLKYQLRKRELGFKKKKVLKHDKKNLIIAKNFKRFLQKREQTLKKQLKAKQFEIDSYKLDMQQKLENYNINIKKAQRAYDTAKENYDINRKDPNYSKANLENDKKDLSKLQQNINSQLDEKRNFEMDVNKSLLKKDENYKELLDRHNQLLDDLKLCDKAIDGFNSKFDKHIPESLRENFDSTIDRHMNNDKNIINIDNVQQRNDPSKINEPKIDDDFMKEYLQKQRNKSIAKNRIKTKQQAIER